MSTQIGLESRFGANPMNCLRSTVLVVLCVLLSAPLGAQEKVGRELICRAEYSDIQRLSAFLLQECCADAPAGVLKMLGMTN